MEEVEKLYNKAVAYFEKLKTLSDNSLRGKYLRLRYSQFTCASSIHCIQLILKLFPETLKYEKDILWYIVNSYIMLGFAHNNLGELVEEKGDDQSAEKYFLQAVEDFTKVLELDPDYRMLYYNRGAAHNNLGELAEKKSDDHSAEKYYLQAIDDYSRALEFNPHDVFSRINYSVVYNKLGELVEEKGDDQSAEKYFLQAVEDFTKVLELDPDHMIAYSDRGLTYNNLGKLAEKKGDDQNAENYFFQAIKDLSNVLEFISDNENNYYHTGVVYYKLGGLAEKKGNDQNAEKYFLQAIDDFSKAIALYSDYADAYNNRGVVHKSLGKLAEEKGDDQSAEKYFMQAVDDFSKVLELNPDYGISYNNRGTMSSLLGEIVLRKRNIELIRLHPDSIIADQLLTNALHYFEVAAFDFNLAIQKQHNYAEAYFNRGNNYKRWGSALEQGTLEASLSSSNFYVATLRNWMYFVEITSNADLSIKIKPIKTIINFFYNYFHQNLLFWAQRLAERNPIILLESNFPNQFFYTANTLSQPLLTYQRYLTYLPQIHKNVTQYINWQILVTYYMGDPFEAYRMADKATDDSNMNDYQVFFYYIKAAIDCLIVEPDLGFDPEDMLVMARNKAESVLFHSEISSTQSLLPIEPDKFYYAGQLFALREQWQDAHRCFELAGEFLPALFMQVVSLGKLSKRIEQEILIHQLIKREKLVPISEAYLFGFRPRIINPNDLDFLKPIQEFAHYQEVQGALFIVRQTYESQLTANHVKQAFYSSSIYWKLHLYEAWQLSSDYYWAILDYLRKAEQVTIQEHILQAEILGSLEKHLILHPENQAELKRIFETNFTLEDLRKQLKNIGGFNAGESLFYIEKDTANQPEELEKSLGLLIRDKENFSVQTKFLFIRYFVIKESLELYPAVCLLFYLSYKELHHKSAIVNKPSSTVKFIIGNLMSESGHETFKETLKEYLPEIIGDFVKSFQLINAIKDPHTINIANAATSTLLATGLKMLVKLGYENFFDQKSFNEPIQEPMLFNLDNPDTLISDYERFKMVFVQLATHQLQYYPTDKEEIIRYLKPFFTQWTAQRAAS
jgi:tetratricopeptide (TPR) repeat protein